MLKVYNSLTNQKEEFIPIHSGKVSMYVCGMTVYDYCHLGHARVMIVFDMIYRHLIASQYNVNYIRNITDIDDKIINRANENNVPFHQLTQRFIDAMHDDERLLGITPPTLEPRATDSIDSIISMIETLIKKNHAYHVTNGDVYYDVSSFKNYGQLSGHNVDELRAGERITVDNSKHDPMDFVLWKAAKPNEPFWDSPWGKGRPGWHIECSAMSTQHLGAHFDIHGGGRDLQFPHHENEIAQSEACTGQTYANYWLHNGFIRVNEEKMSKSLGNFFTIREVLKQYKAETIRYFMLASHYRSPLNYSSQSLDNSHQSLNRLYTALRGLQPAQEPHHPISEPYMQAFTEAMNDDFNTPEALSVLFDLARETNRYRQNNDDTSSITGALLLKLANQLGLLTTPIEAWFKSDAHQATNDTITDTMVETLIEQRLQARKEKNWALSDQIRQQLSEASITLEDTPTGTHWRR